MSNPTKPVVEGEPAVNESRLEALQDLLDRIVDARAGFQVMLDKAEPEFRPVAQKFYGEHDQHASRVAAILTANGGHPDSDGSIMSRVNRAVVSIRAMFDEIDDDVMDQVRRGEARVIDAFDAAIAKMDEGRDREELVAMRNELQTLLGETAHLD